MNKTRIVQIECFYSKFLDDFYQQHPSLAAQPFLAQIDALLDSGFSGGHNVVPYLNPQQWETHYLIPNCTPSQLKWWQEQRGDAQPQNLPQILEAQLQEISPDILYLSDIPGFDFSILDRLTKRPFVIGWHATIVDPRINWAQIDLVLSGIRHIRERACALGAKAAATYMPAAPWYRNPAGQVTTESKDLVFSGSFSGAIHTERALQYKQLAQRIGQHQIELYTQANFPVEPNENIIVRPPVFGRDVLNLYAQSKIVLDSRGDFGLADRDELETSNMRIFEATRAGALLITEYAHNLHDYFNDNEIVTYRNTDELIEKVNFYLHPDNEAARLTIAAAGFARVNKEHLLEHRARWIERIIDTHYIQPLAIQNNNPSNLSGHVYCTSAETDNVIFALAEIQTLIENFPDSHLAVFCQDNFSYRTLQKQNLNVALFKPDMLLPYHEVAVFGKANSEGRWLFPPTMLLALLNQYPDITRLTYVHPTVKILNGERLKFSPADQTIYMLDSRFSPYYRYEQSVLGYGMMDFLSVPHHASSKDLFIRLLGRTDDIALQYQPTVLDPLIAQLSETSTPFVAIKAASPWNFATQDINQLDGSLFLFSLIQRMQPYNYHLLSPSELGEQELSEWRLCYENIYLPYLNKLEDIWQKQLSADITREQTLANVDDRQSTLFFNHNQISQLGYKRLTEQEYRAATTSIAGWNTQQAAATQHNAFHYLMQQYHEGNKRADLLAIASIFSKIKHPNLSVLETGCGSGYNSEFIQEIIAEPYSYTGIDLAPAMVALGEQQYPTRRFGVMSSSELDFSDQQFDVVFNGASLMHTIEFEKAISEAARVSKSFAIFHTVTLADTTDNLYFRKNGYGSPVVEVCFSEAKLAELLKQHHLQPLLMENSIDYNLAQVLGQPTRSVSIACLQLPKPTDTTPNYYYTYFDSNYLTCGMLMIESLTRHDPRAFIYVLCLDQHAENFLRDYAPNVFPIGIAELEQADPEFSACKHNRTKVEWYFTATSAMGHYLFQRFPNIPRLTYLDSDLYFYASPEILHIESQGKSVQIIEHRFSPHLARLAEYGRFNVAWISFFNSEEGLRVIADYRHDCIEWCYDRLEPHRFADQKYLDQWPSRYPNCCVSRWLGADVAHWNVAQWPISYFNSVPYVNAEQMIFYHFQGVKLQPDGKFATQTPELLGIYYQIFYEPYINEMNKMEQKLAPILKDVKRQSIRLPQPPLE